ncbi:MAG: hypothetical protein S0880_31455 [Actinomycetota bacterium]|nr:hypothetical protein [Actinomycetota bacterium]
MTDHDQLHHPDGHPDDRPIDWLRELPPVDPPAGFLDGVIRKVVVRRFAAASALVGLSVVVGAIFVSDRYATGIDEVAVPVEQLVARHQVITSGPTLTATGWRPETSPEPPFVVTVAPVGHDVAGVWWSDGLEALQVYLDNKVSVFEQRGSSAPLDDRYEVVDEVPVPGCENDARILRPVGRAHVALIDCDGVAFTLVATRSSHLFECVQAVVPPEPMRLGQQVRKSAGVLVGAAGP